MVAVPVISPECASDSPGGMLPPATCQLPVRLDLRASFAEYDVPTVAVAVRDVAITGLAGGAGTNSRRFGEPTRSVTFPVVAFATSLARTWDGVRPGAASRISATAPVTCGVAIDVPL